MPKGQEIIPSYMEKVRKALRTMDVTAVLTKVVQEQQSKLQKQESMLKGDTDALQEQQAIISTLLDKRKEIESKI